MQHDCSIIVYITCEMYAKCVHLHTCMSLHATCVHCTRAFGPNAAVCTHANVSMQTACMCMCAIHNNFCKGYDATFM